MNTVLLNLSTLPLPVLVWSLLFGLGAYLLVTAQPLGKPKPDLAERLRRLDVDERVRMEIRQIDARPIFASRLLDALLRPVLDDLGGLVRSLLGRIGLDGRDLDRTLAITRPGIHAAQFFGEKVLCAIIGGAFFPLMNGFGIHPFGSWPVLAWVMGAVGGFLLPDWELDRRFAARRTLLLMELPTIVDMLTIATSAGMALEQALAVVAQQSRGMLAQELQHVVRDMALGSRTLVEALEAMAARNGVPELTACANQLRTAHDQGLPLVPALAAQAEALREQKRLQIVEAGGKATVRMLIPVALFILPVLFVVLLVPAMVQVLRLGGA